MREGNRPAAFSLVEPQGVTCAYYPFASSHPHGRSARCCGSLGDRTRARTGLCSHAARLRVQPVDSLTTPPRQAVCRQRY